MEYDSAKHVCSRYWGAFNQEPVLKRREAPPRWSTYRSLMALTRSPLAPLRRALWAPGLIVIATSGDVVTYMYSTLGNFACTLCLCGPLTQSHFGIFMSWAIYLDFAFWFLTTFHPLSTCVHIQCTVLHLSNRQLLNSINSKWCHTSHSAG